MTFRCRKNFKESALLSLVVIIGIIFCLILVFLLPSILNGPGRVHYLNRNRCRVDKVNYLDNYCVLNDDNQVFAFLYREEWVPCKIVQLNVTIIDPNVVNDTECSYLYPESFEDELEAFIRVSQVFKEGDEFRCVIDNIQHICYPEKDELIIFGCSIAISFISFIIMLIIYQRYKRLDETESFWNFCDEWRKKIRFKKKGKLKANDDYDIEMGQLDIDDQNILDQRRASLSDNNDERKKVSINEERRRSSSTEVLMDKPSKLNKFGFKLISKRN